jgi:hypothetical protein
VVLDHTRSDLPSPLRSSATLTANPSPPPSRSSSP